MRESNSHRTSPPVFETGAIPLCEPSISRPSRSRRSRTPISGFGDHHVAGYTILPGARIPTDGARALYGAEGGNRTHAVAWTNGFTDRRNSILPPQHNSRFVRYSIFKNQKGANPSRTQSSEAAAPLGLAKLYSWRFRERESAPAESTLTVHIIGELLEFRRPIATYDAGVRQVHIEL